jgi:hypothetical protein
MCILTRRHVVLIEIYLNAYNKYLSQTAGSYKYSLGWFFCNSEIVDKSHIFWWIKVIIDVHLKAKTRVDIKWLFNCRKKQKISVISQKFGKYRIFK